MRSWFLDEVGACWDLVNANADEIMHDWFAGAFSYLRIWCMCVKYKNSEGRRLDG